MTTKQLFTRHDVERAARLAVSFFVAEEHATGGADPEAVIARATRSVVEDTAPFYDEATVERMLLWARENGGTYVDADELFDAALTAVQG